MSKSHIGKSNRQFYYHTEETRKKISRALKGKNNPRYGKTFSEETRKKMSKSHIGKKRGPYKKKVK